jgi:hypothetical protein
VSGNTTTFGGASNAITGGSDIEIPTPTFTSALAMIGKTLANAERIVPKSNFFILSHPLSDPDATQVGG